MDSLTQAVLGAALQGAVLGRIQGRRSLLYGAALGTLPDLDVLIRYADPVSQMTYHRGFSHSLFVLTALAAALAWLVSAVARRRWPDKGYRLPRVFLAFWLVLVTHPILDAFTVYGTQLFWPLHLTPQSWAAVFIIDPVYTLPLLGAVLYAAFKGMSGKAVTVLGVALAFSTAYLGYGLAGRMAAEQRFALALDEQGIAVTHVRAVPIAFNSLVWRVLAKTPDGQYYEGISSAFDQEPPEMQRQSLNLEAAQVLRGMPLHERLRWFTDDWLRYDRVGNALVVTDLRMGIPGNYTFRFQMASRDSTGRWNAVTPTLWLGDGVGSMFNGEDLALIWRRIVQQQPPLPLAAWTEKYLGQREAGR
ncbi:MULTISPECIES: metal-dependent hydrolase [Pseudomonas]|uniref:Hydrolase n=1 Tax=Pseudomonas guariconensis TaxID=1288410 RepID=A0AAX0VZA5_9PSED|nr:MULTISPECIES: metal-dependent hydrolase [Pseudomonas]MBH3358149.1 metal-dependent hydrolase [Pseudomonas guariconensis]MCO7622139.1 metal-dependent hydrolase [Pseudomonas guariconensis]MDM9594053.1 metal-dependent hydrolase [Pseudomonas guariconensis]MDM9606880.1 metal-dependent hydrolase [Pseudomonas guariconensis]MDM9611836.1 metal-dependent hydrolase [Pseudomonas guariconensis]